MGPPGHLLIISDNAYFSKRERKGRGPFIEKGHSLFRGWATTFCDAGWATNHCDAVLLTASIRWLCARCRTAPVSLLKQRVRLDDASSSKRVGVRQGYFDLVNSKILGSLRNRILVIDRLVDACRLI